MKTFISNQQSLNRSFMDAHKHSMHLHSIAADNMKRLKHEKTIRITLLVVTMTAIWSLDIATTASILETYITNGFWNINPDMLYHISVWVITVCNFIQVII